MAKKHTPIAGHDEGQRLTPQEAAAMVISQWATGQLDDDASVGDFLLLLYSIAYEQDKTKREAFLIKIETALMPFTPTFDRALNELLGKRLAVAHSLIKEGGTQ